MKFKRERIYYTRYSFFDLRLGDMSIDLSLPWAIGPFLWAATAAASYGIFRFSRRRDGIAGALISALGLLAFIAAFAVHLWRPPVDHVKVLLVAQIVCAGALILFGWLLWPVQEQVRNAVAVTVNKPKIIKGILAGLAFPVILDGLFYLWPATSGYCGKLSSRYSMSKCRGQEDIFGLHDLPMEIYFGVLFGAFGLSVSIWGVFVVCRNIFRTKRGAVTPVVEDRAGENYE
ncbi:hypothetical protein [Rhizobium leguminosarum]|uniref:hypothetical protein n=1 Tax=Rhizobium leguminosarum TaxID=384 RepID=UPI001D320441|nr:hypothetical protein [Rhizobium leguminosarum]MBP2445337.1 hypothetical protein [Rhizobium leguminosarum]